VAREAGGRGKPKETGISPGTPREEKEDRKGKSLLNMKNHPELKL